MPNEPDVTDPSKFFNILIISTIIYVILMLIIIYYALVAPIKTEQDKFSDEYIKQQQQLSIENYFKEKNKDQNRAENAASRLYNSLSNYSVKIYKLF